MRVTKHSSRMRTPPTAPAAPLPTPSPRRGGVLRLPAWLERREVAAALALQAARRALPTPVRHAVDAVTSGHPGHDASAGLYAGAVVAGATLGARVAWGLVVVGAVAFGASHLPPCTRARPPSDLDVRVRPRPRASPAAVPCVEIAVGVALVALVSSTPGAAGGAVAAAAGGVGALLLTRLLAATHCLYQLAASVAGALALVAALDGAVWWALPPGSPRVPHDVHLVGGLFVGLAAAGYVAYRAETGDVPLLRVQRKECELRWWWRGKGAGDGGGWVGGSGSRGRSGQVSSQSFTCPPSNRACRRAHAAQLCQGGDLTYAFQHVVPLRGVPRGAWQSQAWAALG